ncbi:MAG: GNAT family N-acetyltransferase [Chloroflexi bacterium]|nr:GNAT family N-acetyltransferase [Chloroflexota bacterium]
MPDLGSGPLFREAQEADKESIIALSREVHKETRSIRSREPFDEKQWVWLNWEDGPIPGFITIAEDGGKVCGVFPMRARLISVNGRPVEAGVVQGLVTEQTHRRQGVFTKMGLRALEVAPSHGIGLSYAFPNNRSVAGFTGRLGYRLIATIPVYLKLHPLAWLAARLGRAVWRRDQTPDQQGEFPQPAEEGWRIAPVREFDSRFQRLWESVRSANKVSLIRDPAYLTWRFGPGAAHRYHALACARDGQVEAYVVYRMAGILSLRVCVIVDFLSTEGSFVGLMSLLGCIDRIARREGAVATLVAFQAQTDIVSVFKKAGFIAVTQRWNIRPLNLVARGLGGSVQEDELVDPSRWFVTLADWDVL